MFLNLKSRLNRSNSLSIIKKENIVHRWVRYRNGFKELHIIFYFLLEFFVFNLIRIIRLRLKGGVYTLISDRQFVY